MLRAAFRLPDGSVKITGRNHDVNALPAIYRANPALVVDGFVTGDGAFLTRAEAVGIPREPEAAELELSLDPDTADHEGAEDDGFGLDFEALRAQIATAVPAKRGERIYFVGPNDPTDDAIAAWLDGLRASGRIQAGGYVLGREALASGVSKPFVEVIAD